MKNPEVLLDSNESHDSLLAIGGGLSLTTITTKCLSHYFIVSVSFWFLFFICFASFFVKKKKKKKKIVQAKKLRTGRNFAVTAALLQAPDLMRFNCEIVPAFRGTN